MASTLTWHQRKGVQRRLGLHSWYGAHDGADTCEYCGTVAEHRCRAWLYDEPCATTGEYDGCTDECYERCTVPMVCTANDARLKDEHRDYDYEPHHWTAIGEHESECYECGQVTDGAALGEGTPYDDRPSCTRER